MPAHSDQNDAALQNSQSRSTNERKRKRQTDDDGEAERNASRSNARSRHESHSAQSERGIAEQNPIEDGYAKVEVSALENESATSIKRAEDIPKDDRKYSEETEELESNGNLDVVPRDGRHVKPKRPRSARISGRDGTAHEDLPSWLREASNAVNKRLAQERLQVSELINGEISNLNKEFTEQLANAAPEIKQYIDTMFKAQARMFDAANYQMAKSILEITGSGLKQIRDENQREISKLREVIIEKDKDLIEAKNEIRLVKNNIIKTNDELLGQLGKTNHSLESMKDNFSEDYKRIRSGQKKIISSNENLSKYNEALSEEVYKNRKDNIELRSELKNLQVRIEKSKKEILEAKDEINSNVEKIVQESNLNNNKMSEELIEATNLVKRDIVDIREAGDALRLDREKQDRAQKDDHRKIEELANAQLELNKRFDTLEVTRKERDRGRFGLDANAARGRRRQPSSGASVKASPAKGKTGAELDAMMARLDALEITNREFLIQIQKPDHGLEEETQEGLSSLPGKIGPSKGRARGGRSNSQTDDLLEPERLDHFKLKSIMPLVPYASRSESIVHAELPEKLDVPTMLAAPPTMAVARDLKKLGALIDHSGSITGRTGRWYVPSGVNFRKFGEWLPLSHHLDGKRHDPIKLDVDVKLAVSPKETQAALAAGAKRRPGTAEYFAPAGADLSKLAEWVQLSRYLEAKRAGLPARDHEDLGTRPQAMLDERPRSGRVL